jgi:hypothetical protein
MKVSKLDCWREALKANGNPANMLKLAQHLHTWFNAEEEEEPETVASVISLRSPTKLHDWLKERDLRASNFAADLGVEPSTITRLLRGERGCSLDLALRIESATSGEVSPRDLIQSPEPEPHPREAAE